MSILEQDEILTLQEIETVPVDGKILFLRQDWAHNFCPKVAKQHDIIYPLVALSWHNNFPKSADLLLASFQLLPVSTHSHIWARTRRWSAFICFLFSVQAVSCLQPQCHQAKVVASNLIFNSSQAIHQNWIMWLCVPSLNCVSQ